MRSLGPLEAEIMDRLWSWNRRATVREIVDDLQQQRQVAYTTVKTVTDILHRKGLLDRVKGERAWFYEPVGSREEFTAELMHDVLGSGGDQERALSRFVRTISPEELTALRRALDALENEEAR